MNNRRISSVILILVCCLVNAQTAQDFYKKASAKYSDKEYAAAAVDYTRAIDLHPKSAVLFNNRGLCYTKIEQWDKAEEDFSASIELDPEYKQAYLNLGNLYLNKVTYNKALLAYDNALRIDSNYYVVYAKRAYAAFYLNDFNGALHDYSKAIESEPNEYVLYNARGVVYQKLGDITNAIADYDKTLNLNPKAYEAYINRGILHTQLRQYDDAIGDFTVAQSFAGISGEGYYYRGLCRIGQLDAIRTSKEKHLVMDIKENNKLLELACSDFKKAREFIYGRAFESFQEYCVEDITKGRVTKVKPLTDIAPQKNNEVIPAQQAAEPKMLLSDRDKLKAELKAEIIAELGRDYELVPKVGAKK
jgi:tetratricopeptide (TPR) repeat protein